MRGPSKRMRRTPGERVQALYRRHFKHRYGGNAPSWRAISRRERELWAAVETDLLRGGGR